MSCENVDSVSARLSYKFPAVECQDTFSNSECALN